MAITAVILILAGFGIGILSGMLGVGGGTLLLPIFSVGLGMGAVSSAGTSLFTIIPTSLSGVFAHIKGKTCDLKIGLSMGLGGAIGSPLGVMAAQYSPEWMVFAAMALVIAYSGVVALRRGLNALKREKAQAATAVAAAAVAPTPSENSEPSAVADSPSSDAVDPFTLRRFFIALGIGFLSGIAGGYVGLGGGFVMVALMASLLNFPMRLSSGTSLIGIICIAIPGAIAQGLAGNIDYLAGILIACGSIPGAIVGARLMRHLKEAPLRLMFAGLLGVAAVLLVMKQLGLFG